MADELKDHDLLIRVDERVENLTKRIDIMLGIHFPRIEKKIDGHMKNHVKEKAGILMAVITGSVALFTVFLNWLLA